MNGSSITPQLLRFIGFVAVQSLLLNQMTDSVGPYFNVLLYPLFILFLPLQLPVPYLVLSGFAIGLAVDAFVPSWGIHASAGAFSGLARIFCQRSHFCAVQCRLANVFTRSRFLPGTSYFLVFFGQLFRSGLCRRDFEKNPCCLGIDHGLCCVIRCHV